MTFVPAVNPDAEVAIDDGKLSQKYSLIYNNIWALGFDSLLCLSDAINMNLVKEFYNLRLVWMLCTKYRCETKWSYFQPGYGIHRALSQVIPEFSSSPEIS